MTRQRILGVAAATESHHVACARPEHYTPMTSRHLKLFTRILRGTRSLQAATGADVDAHKYELIVSWSAEDMAFVVDIPELPGCMAHGATPSEAVASAQEAIALWIEVARQMGRPIPVPRGRRLSLA